MMIDVFILRNAFKTLTRLNLLNDFELRFMRSITRSQKIQYKFVDSLYETYYHGYKDLIRLTSKQSIIYMKIKTKFENIDVYDRYLDYFELKKITLDDYDKGYFETFKGEFKESHGFKRWLKEKHSEKAQKLR